jgi:hypothetical protein
MAPQLRSRQRSTPGHWTPIHNNTCYHFSWTNTNDWKYLTSKLEFANGGTVFTGLLAKATQCRANARRISKTKTLSPPEFNPRDHFDTSDLHIENLIYQAEVLRNADNHNATEEDM